jgi:hypothetical protein
MGAAKVVVEFGALWSEEELARHWLCGARGGGGDKEPSLLFLLAPHTHNHVKNNSNHHHYSHTHTPHPP